MEFHMLKTERIEYRDGDTLLEGFCAYEDKQAKKPAILVCHDWSGKNDFACEKATKLAELGYVGFALDMYGKGKTGTTKEEKTALMQPLVQDRRKLQKRILAAYECVKTLSPVNSKKIGAIGYCFGGLCVLDLARTGADVTSVASFHGLLSAPTGAQEEHIKAKILVLHGFDDPMVTPDNVMEFGEEMTHAKVDWQLIIYGNAMHAFTNPQANDPGFGTVYNRKADERSWIAMRSFFHETLPTESK